MENGVPQGSILSPILFAILINDLPDVFSCPAALYMQTIAVFGKTDISQLDYIIQDNLNTVQTWCSKWGFKISLPKSAAVLFTRKRTVPDIKIKSNQTEIPIKSEFKYLGIMFQSNGSYNKHNKYAVNKCNKRLNLLRAIKGTSWGSSKAPMLTLHRSLIRSITDHGMEIYFNSSNENRYEIEKIQNEALRLCTGALKSTPVYSLLHACNEMPPNIRYLQLCLFYRTHLLTFSEHPTLSVIQDCWFD